MNYYSQIMIIIPVLMAIFQKSFIHHKKYQHKRIKELKMATKHKCS